MQWLVTLEIDNDLISACRLMSIFRRKGLKIATLAMAGRPAGFSLMAVVDSPEAEVDHIFNLLRRTEGVQHVTYYRHETTQNAPFVFIDADADTSRVVRIIETFPGSKLILASHGKCLLEVPAESRPSAIQAFGEPPFLPFACVKTTRKAGQRELVAAPAQ
jgi:acetolactate synthase regulatory subunit